MAKKRSVKKSATSKYDLLIKAKISLTEIEDVGPESIEVENHARGKVTGKYYSGTHIDTTEGTMMMDGSMQFNVKFLHFTTKGDMIAGQGVATQDPVDRRGRAPFSGEATTWTGSAKLSNLNGARWQFDGTYNAAGESIEVRCTLVEQGGAHEHQSLSNNDHSMQSHVHAHHGHSHSHAHEHEMESDDEIEEEKHEDL